MRKTNDFISVIVPVYNVEKYLKECLDSILSQSYQYFEIILIDDGSTDLSAEICVSYANKYPQIRLYKQDNSGLSAARNFGLEVADGDYIAFVDSDDVLSPLYLETLLDLARKYAADIAACNHVLWYRGDDLSSLGRVSPEELVLSNLEALKCLMNMSHYQCHAHQKLFKANLFEDIKFSVGIIYEDIDIMYRLFAKAETVVYSPSSLYAYRQRVSSIVSGGYAEKRRFDLVKNVQKMLLYIEENYPSMMREANILALWQYLRSYMDLSSKGYKLDDMMSVITAFINENKSDVLFNPVTPIWLKKHIIFYSINKKLYSKVHEMRESNRNRRKFK